MNRNVIIGTVIVLLVAIGAIAITNKKSSTDKDTSPEIPVGTTVTTVTIKEQNGSKQTGTATLEDIEGKTKVTLSLSGAPDSAQPAHIHIGTCTLPGGVVYPLTSVVKGKSETIIDAPKAVVMSQNQLVINVHKSEKEPSSYIACGELTSIPAGVPSAAGTSTPPTPENAPKNGAIIERPAGIPTAN